MSVLEKKKTKVSGFLVPSLAFAFSLNSILILRRKKRLYVSNLHLGVCERRMREEDEER